MPAKKSTVQLQMTSQADVARIKALGGLSAKANFGAHVPMKDDILRLPTRSGEIFDCVVLERECAPTAKGAVWRLHVAGI